MVKKRFHSGKFELEDQSMFRDKLVEIYLHFSDFSTIFYVFYKLSADWNLRARNICSETPEQSRSHRSGLDSRVPARRFEGCGIFAAKPLNNADLADQVSIRGFRCEGQKGFEGS